MKLMDQVRQVLRVKHYALATEQCYCQWIRRFIFFHGVKHPNTMGAEDVERFLTHLATDKNVAASTFLRRRERIIFLSRQGLRKLPTFFVHAGGCRSSAVNESADLLSPPSVVFEKFVHGAVRCDESKWRDRADQARYLPHLAPSLRHPSS